MAAVFRRRQRVLVAQVQVERGDISLDSGIAEQTLDRHRFGLQPLKRVRVVLTRGLVSSFDVLPQIPAVEEHVLANLALVLAALKPARRVARDRENKT